MCPFVWQELVEGGEIGSEDVQISLALTVGALIKTLCVEEEVCAGQVCSSRNFFSSDCSSLVVYSLLEERKLRGCLEMIISCHLLANFSSYITCMHIYQV